VYLGYVRILVNRVIILSVNYSLVNNALGAHELDVFFSC